MKHDDQRTPYARRQIGPLGPVILVLLAASLACTLTASPGEPTQTSPQPSPTLAPLIIIPSATPLFTPTPIPTSTPTPVPCYPQVGWPVYIVQPGDTLSSLAQRTFSTVDTLALANCLANPNQIFVGSPLYVPMLPLTPAPTATVSPVPTGAPITTNLPVFLQPLSVDRHWMGTLGYWATYSQGVRVNAGDVLNAMRVKFYANDHANGGVTIFIGQDDWPNDGAFVDYTFPHVGLFTFQAIAENEIGSTTSTVFTIQYDPAFVPPEGQYNLLSLTPSLGSDGTATILPANSVVMIGWAHAPAGAQRVDFMLLPPNAAPDSTGPIVGTDWTPADGAQVSWLVPAGTQGTLEAMALMPDGSRLVSRPAAVRANY